MTSMLVWSVRTFTIGVILREYGTLDPLMFDAGHTILSVAAAALHSSLSLHDDACSTAIFQVELGKPAPECLRSGLYWS